MSLYVRELFRRCTGEHNTTNESKRRGGTNPSRFLKWFGKAQSQDVVSFH